MHASAFGALHFLVRGETIVIVPESFPEFRECVFGRWVKTGINACSLDQFVDEMSGVEFA